MHTLSIYARWSGMFHALHALTGETMPDIGALQPADMIGRAHLGGRPAERGNAALPRALLYSLEHVSA